MIKARGFTIIELMIAIVVLGVLVALAAPSMGDLLDRHRLVGAGEAVYAQLQTARSEAIKQMATVRISFSGTNQCLGFSTDTSNTGCDCSAQLGGTTPCSILADGANPVLKRTLMSDHPSIALALADSGTAANSFSIDLDGVRGVSNVTSEDSRTIRLTSPQGRELNVFVNPLGRVRVCWPTGKPAIAGYRSCA